MTPESPGQTPTELPTGLPTAEETWPADTGDDLAFVAQMWADDACSRGLGMSVEEVSGGDRPDGAPTLGAAPCLPVAPPRPPRYRVVQPLSAEQIAEADWVLLVGVEPLAAARFVGKPVYRARPAEALADPRAFLQRAAALASVEVAGDEAGLVAPEAGAAPRIVAVTACPAIPSLTPRLLAIGVNRLAGRNSATIRPNTPRARA